jgi:hypothetical protein
VSIGGYEHFSAGGEQTGPDPLPELPAAAFALRPRPYGTAWDGSEQRRSWPVRVGVLCSPEQPDVAAELIERLARRSELADVHLASRIVGRFDVKFAVVARDMDAALRIGESVTAEESLGLSRPAEVTFAGVSMW